MGKPHFAVRIANCYYRSKHSLLLQNPMVVVGEIIQKLHEEMLSEALSDGFLKEEEFMEPYGECMLQVQFCPDLQRI